MIQKSTLQFLIDLSLNNSKAWFDDHRKDYDLAKADFTGFVQEIIDQHSESDKSIKDIKAKDCLFRINRDVRFSNNKAPYKTNFGASICMGGRKSMTHAGYYFHLEPDNSFTGGGLYDPEPEVLNTMRQKISGDLSNFNKILGGKFNTVYGPITGHDEYSLKRVPKGFEATDPAAEYLKLKSYIAMIKIENDVIISDKLLPTTLKSWEALQPLIDYVNEK